MIDKTIIKRVKLWLKDFKKVNPELNVVDCNTFEEEAYLIFKTILEKIKLKGDNAM